MEVLTIITGIVILVFSILQIVLFFKMWGMTNDIRIIKKQMVPNTLSGYQVKKLYIKNILKNDPNISNVLFDAIYDEMEICYNRNGKFEDIVEKYRVFYERANLEIPEIFTSIKNNSDYRNVFNPE